MSSRTFILAHAAARAGAIECVRNAPDGSVVRVGGQTRNLDQNAAMWPILDCFARQRQWMVNGRMEWLSSEEWKDVLTCAFDGETTPRMAAGMNGGVVLLGKRTSKFGKKRFSEWLDFLHAAAAELGVEIEQMAEVMVNE